MVPIRNASLKGNAKWPIKKSHAANVELHSLFRKANKRSTPNVIYQHLRAAKCAVMVERTNAAAAEWVAIVKCTMRSVPNVARPARFRLSLALKAKADARSCAKHVSWLQRRIDSHTFGYTANTKVIVSVRSSIIVCHCASRFVPLANNGWLAPTSD